MSNAAARARARCPKRQCGQHLAGARLKRYAPQSHRAPAPEPARPTRRTDPPAASRTPAAHQPPSTRRQSGRPAVNLSLTILERRGKGRFRASRANDGVSGCGCATLLVATARIRRISAGLPDRWANVFLASDKVSKPLLSAQVPAPILKIHLCQADCPHVHGSPFRISRLSQGQPAACARRRVGRRGAREGPPAA